MAFEVNTVEVENFPLLEFRAAPQRRQRWQSRFCGASDRAHPNNHRPMTEYSGFKYATFFLAEYFGMFAISGLAVTLFLGGWHAPIAVLEFVPSYVWFFLKLSALLFVYIWVRGTLPRTRVDQIMNFAWKFMLPMAFACIVAAAVWHYQGRGLAGWLWSLAVIAIVYLALSLLLETRKKFARRTYRFAE